MKRTLGLTLLLFATLFSCMRQEKPITCGIISCGICYVGASG